MSATHAAFLFFWRQHQRLFEDHCFDKLVLWESRKSPGTWISLNEGSECECCMCNSKKPISPPNGNILLNSHTHLKITSCHCSFFSPSVPTPHSLSHSLHLRKKTYLPPLSLNVSSFLKFLTLSPSSKCLPDLPV